MLAQFCPERLDRYFEPFLGSGALFFHLVQSRPRFEAVLSDSNYELINVYLQVRDRTAELVELLQEHQQNYYAGRERYYYSVRDLEPTSGVERAARMIFLNRTCYNGLFRVNRSGRFNVPHGTYERPTICNRDALFSAAGVLARDGVRITHASYTQTTRSCAKGDVVYFDPPYLPLTKTANFVDYTRESFGWHDHVELAGEFVRLHDLGCAVILSNSDTRKIRDLYGDFTIKTARVERLINCNASRRTGQRELMILSSSPNAVVRARKKKKDVCRARLAAPATTAAVQAIRF
ncbi:DNA adenine methylase Dam [Candidatus Nitrososphaera evergladensis SR1]|uniref:site-specific DNA-methyltransferase (adenine-specific) n=2 Tax=Nitrososphaera TaxID=497726 RepID=A0A075MYT2_9ARCH|nr:DNA adenine methylase Dam [Candidatus Nitrososphaera evergladensis SR1]